MSRYVRVRLAQTLRQLSNIVHMIVMILIMLRKINRSLNLVMSLSEFTKYQAECCTIIFIHSVKVGPRHIQHTYANNYENWLAVYKVIAKINRLTFCPNLYTLARQTWWATLEVCILMRVFWFLLSNQQTVYKPEWLQIFLQLVSVLSR